MKDFEKEVVIMKDEKILSNEELLEITGGKFNQVSKSTKPFTSIISISPVMALYAVYPNFKDK